MNKHEKIEKIEKENEMPKIAPYWKAAIAGLSIVATGLATVAADPDIAGVLPTGWGAGVLVAGTVVGTWIVKLKGNLPRVEDIDDGLSKLPLTEAEAIVKALADKYLPKN